MTPSYLLQSAMSTMQLCHRAETWCVQEAMFSYANLFSRYMYAYTFTQMTGNISFNDQFSYGELLATLSLRNGATVCIIRGVEAVEVEPGVPLLSEFDCPYYNLTRTIFSTDSSNISAAISMMHHCEEEEGGCHFVETDVCQLVERQETIQHKLTFQHDCRNLHCV